MERGLVLNQVYRDQVINALEKMGEADAKGFTGALCVEAAALLEKDGEAIATLVDYVMTHAEALGKGVGVLCEGLKLINEADAKAIEAAQTVIAMTYGGGVKNAEPDY